MHPGKGGFLDSSEAKLRATETVDTGAHDSHDGLPTRRSAGVEFCNLQLS